MVMNNIIWPVTVEQARAVQRMLKNRVLIRPLRKEPQYVAGVDASFGKGQVLAVASLYSYPHLTHLEDAAAAEPCHFPYRTGLLSFREGPGIIRAIEKLTRKPDIILFDGQGIAHPQNMGIASHVGLMLSIPSIGCAKSRLVGAYNEPRKRKGSWTYLIYRNQHVGAVVRTRTGVKPLFVSPGHMIDIRASVRIILQCVSRYRSPEPLRHADMVSKQLKQNLIRTVS